MESPQSDIITSITEVRKESVSEVTNTLNTKQKLTVPRRIMEEEVWLSGSELKTDNSSSEEDRPVDAQDRAKKGAKKKTKTFTQSERSRKQILRQSREETVTESVEMFKEVTSTSSSTVADKKETKSTPRFDSTFDALDKMLSKCEDNSNNFMKISCNKADDEKSQLQKIKTLEERISRAEKIYLQSSRTGFFQDVKLPKLNNYDSDRLNTLLNSNDEIYTQDENYVGFKLKPAELEKLANISNQLQCPLPKSSANVDHDSGFDGASEINMRSNNCMAGDNTCGSFAMNFASLTDSEKQMIFNSSDSDLSLSDSIDDYGSCEEAHSEFASFTNLDIQN